MLQEAGALAILLGGIPPESAAHVREQLDISVYGIDAGPSVDSQLVISHDIPGMFAGDVAPGVVQRHAELGTSGPALTQPIPDVTTSPVAA